MPLTTKALLFLTVTGGRGALLIEHSVFISPELCSLTYTSDFSHLTTLVYLINSWVFALIAHIICNEQLLLSKTQRNFHLRL